MDSYREHPSDFDPPADAGPESAAEVAAAIGTDERRMHVRAYNYWVSLLDGRDYPSIEDLEPGEVEDFAANSVLLDFTAGRDNPATPYIGTAIREECGIGDGVRTIDDVPGRSLLSRLTDHYMQIIAHRAPVGFEAEFDNQRSESICYRGILMPFSSDGETIDFIYGVINWKRSDSGQSAAEPIAPTVEPVPTWPEPEVLELDQPIVPMADSAADDPEEEFDELGYASLDIGGIDAPEAAPAPHFSWEDGPLGEADGDEAVPEIALGDDAGLADRLSAARETAEAVKSADGRSRAALYRALALAYDFAVAAQQDPDDYAELLEESGMKAQARAPMTPIVKLVFGIDYDKTRLTEFAAALAYAQRQAIALGGFLPFVEAQTGGLKALVAAERQARRPEPKPDTRGDAAREKLRAAAPLSLDALPGAEEFSLVLTRRSADGRSEAVAIVDDEALVERAIRCAGR